MESSSLAVNEEAAFLILPWQDRFFDKKVQLVFDEIWYDVIIRSYLHK
jgi:hypothetical protein